MMVLLLGFQGPSQLLSVVAVLICIPTNRVGDKVRLTLDGMSAGFTITSTHVIMPLEMKKEIPPSAFRCKHDSQNAVI